MHANRIKDAFMSVEEVEAKLLAGNIWACEYDLIPTRGSGL